jgi:hypothetical protein
MSSTIWLPVPVATLFRRLVNVISTASIAHHYLLPSKSSPAVSDDFPELDLDPRNAYRLLRENGQQGLGAVPTPPRMTGVDDLDGFLKGTGSAPTSHTVVQLTSQHLVDYQYRGLGGPHAYLSSTQHPDPRNSSPSLQEPRRTDAVRLLSPTPTQVQIQIQTATLPVPLPQNNSTRTVTAVRSTG